MKLVLTYLVTSSILSAGWAFSTNGRVHFPALHSCGNMHRCQQMLHVPNFRSPRSVLPMRMSGKDVEDLKRKTSATSESENVSPYAWLVAFLLLGLNVHNQWTRALVYYLVSFKAPDTPENSRLYMNKDLSFGEEQYALLASFGFTALFTIFSLGAGRLADKVNRAWVVVGGTAAWSLATAAQAAATSFDTVLEARAFTGISQAFLNPQAFGLLAAYFPESRQATANGIYTAGVYLGGALASLSILLDERVGWRAAAADIALVGAALAALSAAALRDPRAAAAAAAAAPAVSPADAAAAAVTADGPAAAGEADGATAAGAAAAAEAARPDAHKAPAEGLAAGLRAAAGAAGEVLGSPFVQLLFAASAMRFCAGYGIGVWKGPLYRELFPGFEDQFSVVNALVISAGGVLSSVAGSAVADRLGVNEPRARLWVPAAGSLLAVPLWIGTCEAGNFYTSMGLLFLEYIVAECWFGPTIASLYKVLNAIGNVMPVVIGALHRDSSLADVMAVTVSVAYALSGIFFFLAAEKMPGDSPTPHDGATAAAGSR